MMNPTETQQDTDQHDIFHPLGVILDTDSRLDQGDIL